MKIIKHESGRELHLRFWIFGWWGEAFLPTDFRDAWVWKKVRPNWYWFLRAIKMFFGIIFRDFHGVIIMPMTAWTVARGINCKEIKITR